MTDAIKEEFNRREDEMMNALLDVNPADLFSGPVIKADIFAGILTVEERDELPTIFFIDEGDPEYDRRITRENLAYINRLLEV